MCFRTDVSPVPAGIPVPLPSGLPRPAPQGPSCPGPEVPGLLVNWPQGPGAKERAGFELPVPGSTSYPFTHDRTSRPRPPVQISIWGFDLLTSHWPTGWRPRFPSWLLGPPFIHRALAASQALRSAHAPIP